MMWLLLMRVFAPTAVPVLMNAPSKLLQWWTRLSAVWVRLILPLVDTDSIFPEV